MSISVVNVIVEALETPSPRLLALPTPQNVVWNKGIVEQIYEQRNPEGELVFDSSSVTERKQTINVSYSVVSKEIIALMNAYKLVNGAVSNIPYALSQRLPESRVIDAAVAGFNGFGVVLDSPNAALSYRNDYGISIPLTRVNTATFSPATVATFKVELNGLITLSDDVPPRSWITYSDSYPVTAGDSLSTLTWNRFALEVHGVLVRDAGDKEVFTVEFPLAELHRQENSSMDFTASPVSVNFRVLGGRCAPVIKFPRRLASCPAA